MGIFDALLGRKNRGAEIDPARRKQIYADFREISKAELQAEDRRRLDKVRVKPGQDPYAAGAAALIGGRMDGSGGNEARDQALRKTAHKHRISGEQLDSIIEEAKAQGW